MASMSTLDDTSPSKIITDAAAQLDDARRAELTVMACGLLDEQDADK